MTAFFGALFATLLVAVLLAATTAWFAPRAAGATDWLRADLSRVRPLLVLPALLVAALGASYSTWLGLICGAGLGVMIWWALQPWSVPTLWSHSSLWPCLAASLTAAAACAGCVAALGVEFGGGGAPGATLFLALLVWLLATVAFCASISTTKMRLVGLVISAAAVIDLAAWVGLMPLPAMSPTLVAVIVLATLVALSVVAILHAPAPGSARPPALISIGLRGQLEVAALWLVAISLAAAALSLFFAAEGQSEIAIDRSRIWYPTHSAKSLDATGDWLHTKPRDLLSGFMPVPVIAPLDATFAGGDVHPTKAKDYLPSVSIHDFRDGSLERPLHEATVANLPSTCPDYQLRPCFRMDLCSGCPVGGEDPTFPLYGVVFRKNEKSGQNVNWDAASRAGFGDLAIVLQYWAFYARDQWSTRLLGFAQLTQAHDADWESVTIGLSATRPLFVAMSEHCGGLWDRWDDLPAIATVPMPQQNTTTNPDPPFNLHPEVMVAVGSHAFYPAGFRGRAPDWASCTGSPLPDQLTALISSAANIVEKVQPNTDVHLTPTIVSSSEINRVMSYPGYWSPGDTMTVVLPNRTFQQDPNAAQPGGPLTPALQSLGRDPVGTIFLGRHWTRYRPPA